MATKEAQKVKKSKQPIGSKKLLSTNEQQQSEMEQRERGETSNKGIVLKDKITKIANWLRKQMKKRRVKAEETRSKKMIRVRMFPIWLRLVIVMSLIIVSLVVGAMVGYSVIGDGKALDVFKKSTWTHIGDMVNGK